MKSKLVKELLGVIRKVKDTQSDVILDINDENKESVYSELLIPLMNLTNSDTVKQMHEKLEFLINGNVESDEYAEFAEVLVNYVLDDDGSETNFSEEIDSLVVNCMAVLNKFAEIVSVIDEDKKEGAFDAINSEIMTIMNATVKPEDSVTPTESNDEAVDTVPETPDEPETPEDPADTEEVDNVIEVIPAGDNVDETPWGEVNKIELKDQLKSALDGNEENKAVIDEVFALVKSYDKIGDWQWPHHVLQEGDKVVLNVNGLKTAALFLLKPNASKNLTTDERTSIATHLLRHYDEIGMEKPAKLGKLADGKESTIVINIKDDEMKEFGEMFKVNVEEIGTYIGLMEALLTDFVNSGIIDIESETTDYNESVVAVKLDKAQTEEFIKYFDTMSDDIVSILSSDFGSLSYKQTNADITGKYEESNKNIDLLTAQINTLNTQIASHKDELSKLANSTVNQELTQTKFHAIIDFITSSESVDETIIQFINTVIEAESKRDIQYMAKIGKSFMKSNANAETTKFIKKSSIISKFGSTDVSDLLDLVGNNSESAVPTGVNNRISQLSSYLD